MVAEVAMIPPDATALMTGAARGTAAVRLNCSELEPAELEAVTTKVNTPAVVGVPLRIPVEDPNDSPPGSAPPVTLHVIGPVPRATRVCAKGDPVNAF
jgi:hypothetical protein